MVLMRVPFGNGCGIESGSEKKEWKENVSGKHGRNDRRGTGRRQTSVVPTYFIVLQRISVAFATGCNRQNKKCGADDVDSDSADGVALWMSQYTSKPGFRPSKVWQRDIAVHTFRVLAN